MPTETNQPLSNEDKASVPSTPGSVTGNGISEATTIQVGKEGSLSSRFGLDDDMPPSTKPSHEGQPSMRQKLSLNWKLVCRSLNKKYNRLPANPTTLERVRYTLLCPVKGSVSVYVALTVILLMLWGVGASLSSDFHPGGHLFALLLLVVTAYIGGCIIELISLPPLLGMLLVGILFNNVPGVTIGRDLDAEWSGKLRNIALVVILSRAGLGLDPDALRRLSLTVLRLAFTPCLVEAGVVAVASHLLIDLPWLWAFMLGFILAAVSPAVVVPCLLNLQERGYGVDKGIPTLVIAAASVDDVLAISAFGIILGMTFSEGDIGEKIASGPIEVLMGLGYGVLLGILSWYFPHKHTNEVTLLRVLFLLLGGLLAVLGSGEIGYAGAGALGCLVFAFGAAFGWRKQGMLQHDSKVLLSFGIMWKILQPVLFGLIGTEIDISSLDANNVLLGLVTVAIALVFRLITSFLVTFGAGLTLRERLFISIAWLPKATVQAAIGPVPFYFASKSGSFELLDHGMKVLTLAVLVILVTAPIGAAGIMISGPLLLNHTPQDQQRELQQVPQQEEDEEGGGEVPA